MSNLKEMVIWGGGKIGRGFVADLFNSKYKLNFIDADKNLVQQMKKRSGYTVLKMSSKDKTEKKLINNYNAYHISEKDLIRKKLLSVSTLALAVYPSVFPAVAEEFAEIIEEKAKKNNIRSLDIIICANISHSASKFRKLLIKKLSKEGKKYFDKKVGLVEALVIRMAVEPSPKMLEEDPLVVLTNGYPEMPVDKFGFKGERPEIKGLKYTENIEAEETRKIYTYNMVHAVLAYLGKQKQYENVIDCINDDDICQDAINALNEIGNGLQNKYSFSEDEMEKWNKNVLKNMANPILKDKVNRVGADPVRKLKRDDRLTGSALLCRKQGILPYYLAKGIAYGLMFDNPDDESSQVIKGYMQDHELKETIKKFTGLDREKELIQLIYQHYKQANNAKKENYIQEDHQKVKLLKKAYKSGCKYEKLYKGCAQCTLLAMNELIDKENSDLFQAASGLSGGIALCGDGSCGGYTGGVLLMGSIVGRRMNYLDDGDKEAQYKSYGMAQKLHDKFVETYGSVTCRDIHKKIFGKAYCLRTKPVRNKFEEAGAHKDKCTSLIATSCQWVTEILLEEEMI